MATKAKPGPANFARSPGPLTETSQRAGSLAILTSLQSPNTNARLLWTSSRLLLPVMEKGVTALSSNSLAQINLKKNYLLFLFLLDDFTF